MDGIEEVGRVHLLPVSTGGNVQVGVFTPDPELTTFTKLDNFKPCGNCQLKQNKFELCSQER